MPGVGAMHNTMGHEIIGIGVDMIRIDRIANSIARFGNRFLTRLYTSDELAAAKQRGKGRVRALATGFAAKEAVWKAWSAAQSQLGGDKPAGLGLRQIEIRRDSNGKPQVALLVPEARAALRIDCSLSDDDGLALAFVVISRHYACTCKS